VNALAQQLAAQLNGREYLHEIEPHEEASARRDGLVVVFGASDDLMEFRGAINDELGAYEGTTAHLTRLGLIENDCDDDACPHFKRAKARASTIVAKWHDNGPYSWTFETAIPHAKFKIFEDGKPYCRGIVFALEDVPS